MHTSAEAAACGPVPGARTSCTLAPAAVHLPLRRARITFFPHPVPHPQGFKMGLVKFVLITGTKPQ
jgi:hypothetical protein